MHNRTIGTTPRRQFFAVGTMTITIQGEGKNIELEIERHHLIIH